MSAIDEIGELYRRQLGHLLWREKLILNPREAPVIVRGPEASRALDRPRLIQSFYQCALAVYKAVCDEDLPPVVGQLLFSGSPPGYGQEFHRSIGTTAFDIPQTFRTDEDADGKILEIQAPGSFWGESLLLSDYFDRTMNTSASSLQSFCQGIRAYTGNPDPVVLHLTDAASSQAGVRYFINRTRLEGLRYYGWDPEVKVGSVDHVRAHSFQSLTNENLFAQRLAERREGKRGLFDLPVNIIFDTKVLLPLPFWRHTREFFDAEHRDALAFTAFLEPDGVVELLNGELVQRSELAALPPRERGYFLKYAGGDLSRNWGSRAVFRLRTRGQDWRRRLDDAWSAASAGEAWVIQTESRAASKGLTENEEHEKHSWFCAYQRLVGGVLMTRPHFKVHGGPETSASPLVVAL